MFLRVLWFFLVLSYLMLGVGCAYHRTPKGIAYSTIGESLNIEAIDPNQIDAAYMAAKLAMMGAEGADLDPVAPTDISVVFCDTPPTYRGEKMQGATIGTLAYIYLRAGSERCLFKNSVEGALTHEMGHIVLEGLTGSADPDHLLGLRWGLTETFRGYLEAEVCK